MPDITTIYRRVAARVRAARTASAPAGDAPHYGTVQSTSSGTANVLADGAEGTTPCTSTSATVKAGDRVEFRVVHGKGVIVANYSDPSASSDGLASTDAVARAVAQHFWNDDAGVHVTEAARDDYEDGATGYGLLANSYGLLLMLADKYLASLTGSALEFFDGAGNQAANSVASFAATLVRIGKAAAGHVEITAAALRYIMSDGSDSLWLGTKDGSLYNRLGRTDSKFVWLDDDALHFGNSHSADVAQICAESGGNVVHPVLNFGNGGGGTGDLFPSHTWGSLAPQVEGDVFDFTSGQSVIAEMAAAGLFSPMLYANRGVEVCWQEYSGSGTKPASSSASVPPIAVYNSNTTTSGMVTTREKSFGVGWDGSIESKSDITLKGHSSAVGSIVTVDGSSVNLATATEKTLCSIQLPAGTWVVALGVVYEANGTGRRSASFGPTANDASQGRMRSATQPATAGAQTRMSLTTVEGLSATTTLYLCGYQNSGGALSTQGYIRAARIC